MPVPSEPTYLVNAHADPILIRIVGRASYLNVAPLCDFMTAMQQQGRRDFVLDTERCTGMDSTFLGLLAGLALEVKQAEKPGSVVLCRLSPRNLELIRNLGLHRLLEVDADPAGLSFGTEAGQALGGPPPSPQVASAHLILRAHESLCEADEGNRARFQDVITYLRQETGG